MRYEDFNKKPDSDKKQQDKKPEPSDAERMIKHTKDARSYLSKQVQEQYTDMEIAAMEGGQELPERKVEYVSALRQVVAEGYGKYYCSTDKKCKERKGPKQTRQTEAVNPAQQAAIAIAKKKKQGVSEMDNRTPQGDRREQRANSPEAQKQREKEFQDNLKKTPPELRKKLRLSEPKDKGVEEGSDLPPKVIEMIKKIAQSSASPEHKKAAIDALIAKYSKQGVAEGANSITYQQQKGKNKFSVKMLVNGKSAGIFQYDANTGRTITELDSEFRGQGLGQRLILKGIYTAAMLGLDYVEDESRTEMFDRAMDSLADAGYIVNDDERWYVTTSGEQFLKQGVAEGYTGRETKDGTWRVFKDGKAVAVAGPFKSREEAAAWIKKQKTGVAEGSDDTVSFEVDSENAYNRIMKKFRSVIDWDGDTMVAPRKYWDAIQELAYQAGGEATEVGYEQGVNESTEQSLQKKIQSRRDALGLAREQRRARGQHQQGQREIKLQAEIDNLNDQLRELKKQGVKEGRYFRTAYGYAGGYNEKTGGKYKHPEDIRADREAKQKAKDQEPAKNKNANK